MDIGTLLGLCAAAFLVAWILYGKAAKKSLPAEIACELEGDKAAILISAPALVLTRFKSTPRLAANRRAMMNIVETTGLRRAKSAYVIHRATRCVYVLLAGVFCLMIGAFTKVDAGYAAFCAVAIIAAYMVPDSRLSAATKKRKLEIALDFPDFLVQLALLINAGMNVNKSWERVAEGFSKNRALGRELELAAQEIRAGKSESRAYEDFAKRCRMPEVTRVVSVLLQNVRKGNAELVSILRVHANECWEMRRNAAKKMGEEASSKMLAPMAIMLVAIMLIVTAPAMLAMQGAF